MKLILVSAFLLPLTAASAFAQAPASPSTPASVEATASAVTLNGDSPIGEIAATAAGKAALEKDIPGVLEHPAYEQFKAMSLRQLAPMSQGIITDEKIAALEADLKKSK